MKEASLVAACLAVLREERCQCVKVNTGAFGTVGTPDIFACIRPTGRLLVVECKVGTNKPTAAQQLQLRLWREAGAIAVDVREDGPAVLREIIANERKLG